MYHGCIEIHVVHNETQLTYLSNPSTPGKRTAEGQGILLL